MFPKGSTKSSKYEVYGIWKNTKLLRYLWDEIIWQKKKTTTGNMVSFLTA